MSDFWGWQKYSKLYWPFQFFGGFWGLWDSDSDFISKYGKAGQGVRLFSHLESVKISMGCESCVKNLKVISSNQCHGVGPELFTNIKTLNHYWAWFMRQLKQNKKAFLGRRLSFQTVGSYNQNERVTDCAVWLSIPFVSPLIVSLIAHYHCWIQRYN